jgi:F-type H+-transporting ATPase subunit b
VLPDLSVVWVIFFLIVLTVILDRLLFRPIQRVIQEREAAGRSARELAERSAREAAAATAEFEAKTSAARAEVYRQMDDVLRVARQARADLLTETRSEAEREIAAASARLQAEADEARRRLQADAETLGAAAAERILGRKAS